MALTKIPASLLDTTAGLTVAGDLTVSGTTTTVNSTTLEVADKNITINKGSGDTSSNANGAGITIQDAVDASNDATILWDSTNDEFDFSHQINVNGDIASTGGTTNNRGMILSHQNNTNVSYVGRSENGAADTTNRITFDYDNDKMTLDADGDITILPGASNNVGIGENSPDNTLHINSGGDNVNTKFESTDTEVRLQLKDTTGTAYIAARNDIRFGNDTSTERMRIDNEGNISFGAQKQDPNWSQFFNALSGNYGSHLAFQNNNVAVATLGNNYYINNSTLNERVLAQPTQVFKLDHQGNFLFESAASGTAGATFSFSEKMRLNVSGRLGIGETTLTGALVIRGEVGQSFRAIDFTHNSSTVVGNIVTSTSSTAYNTSSDYRLKENVVNLDNALDRVAQLQPKRFNFITDADTTVDGFLAHEVQDIVPEAIQGEKDAVDSEGNPEYQGIDQSKLVPLLTKAIQELKTELDAAKARITELEG